MVQLLPGRDERLTLSASGTSSLGSQLGKTLLEVLRNAISV